MDSESLARAIRSAAGVYNDKTLPVTLLVKRMADRLAKLEAERQWIPVAERLPDFDTPVLVAGNIYGRRYVTTAMRMYDGEDWAWGQFIGSHKPDLHNPKEYEFYEDYSYTDWMPLPSPPIDTGSEV
jgi:hypothetical protein